MTSSNIETCAINTIRESPTELSIFAEKKQMIKVGNIAITSINECLFEVYDFRTGFKIATLAIRKELQSVEFFRNFEIFTRDIISVRDILLKQFIEIKLRNIPCGICMEFKMEEFEQFLFENQP